MSYYGQMDGWNGDEEEIRNEERSRYEEINDQLADEEFCSWHYYDQLSKSI